MSGPDYLPRLTDEELAELQREVDAAPSQPVPDGPLPQLESDNPEWRAARLRQRAQDTAAGAGRSWTDPARPLVKTSSSALRRFESQRARLDILCQKRSLLARVLATDVPGVYEVAYEASPTESGVGWGVQIDALADVGDHIKVACRCSERMHVLDPLRLRAESWEGRTGKPREVGVSSVVAGSG